MNSRIQREAFAKTYADGLGFVQHERLDEGIVAFTVFHQLHCLVCKLRHSCGHFS